MLQAILENLNRATLLLTNLTNAQYADASVAPYYSSIGSHFRHILDFYDCILEGYENRTIDLTARRRDLMTEQLCEKAQERILQLNQKLQFFENELDQQVKVVDDLGSGAVSMNTSLGALLLQANSHTIHHYAIINYILANLGIQFADHHFGYNPTTPTNAH